MISFLQSIHTVTHMFMEFQNLEKIGCCRYLHKKIESSKILLPLFFLDMAIENSLFSRQKTLNITLPVASTILGKKINDRKQPKHMFFVTNWLQLMILS